MSVEAALRDRERTKLILHHSIGRISRTSNRAESKGKRDRIVGIGSIRNSRPSDACPAAQHRVSFGNAMRFDATRAPTLPTDSPSACTLTLTLPTSLHREPLSPLPSLTPHCSMAFRVSLPRTRTRLAHFSATLHCAFSVLFLPTRLHPCSVFLPLPLIHLSFAFLPLSLSFHFPFDSVSSFRYLASFFPPSLYFALSASDNSFLSHRLDLAGSSLRKDDSSFDPDTYERNITTRIRVVSRADNWRVNCVAIESSFGSSFRPPLGRDGSSFRGLKGRENYYRFRVSLIVLSRSFDPLSAPRFTHPICPLPFHLHCPDLA